MDVLGLLIDGEAGPWCEVGQARTASPTSLMFLSFTQTVDDAPWVAAGNCQTADGRSWMAGASCHPGGVIRCPADATCHVAGASCQMAGRTRRLGRPNRRAEAVFRRLAGCFG